MCPRGNKCEVAIIDFDSIVENGAGHSLKRIPGTYGYRAPEVRGGSIREELCGYVEVLL